MATDSLFGLPGTVYPPPDRQKRRGILMDDKDSQSGTDWSIREEDAALKQPVEMRRMGLWMSGQLSRLSTLLRRV